MPPAGPRRCAPAALQLVQPPGTVPAACAVLSAADDGGACRGVRPVRRPMCAAPDDGAPDDAAAYVMPQQYAMPSMPLAAQAPCAPCAWSMANCRSPCTTSSRVLRKRSRPTMPSRAAASGMLHDGTRLRRTVHGHGGLRPGMMMMDCDGGGCGWRHVRRRRRFTAPTPKRYVAPGPAAE